MLVFGGMFVQIFPALLMEIAHLRVLNKVLGEELSDSDNEGFEAMVAWTSIASERKVRSYHIRPSFQLRTIFSLGQQWESRLCRQPFWAWIVWRCKNQVAPLTPSSTHRC